MVLYIRTRLWVRKSAEMSFKSMCGRCGSAENQWFYISALGFECGRVRKRVLKVGAEGAEVRKINGFIYPH